jgi:hypothetical protein
MQWQNNLRLPILRAIATADTLQQQRFYVLLGCIQKLRHNNNTYPLGVAYKIRC